MSTRWMTSGVYLLLMTAPLLTGCRSTLQKQLGRYGYIELRPPVTHVPPGTLV